MMEKTDFSVIKATREAYLFAWREGSYLLKIALIPLFLDMATSVVLVMQDTEFGTLELFLWRFPATVFFCWYMFAEARLILLGEKVQNLPPSPEYLVSRKRALVASVSLLLLYNMALTFMSHVTSTVSTVNPVAASVLKSGLSLLALIALIWSLRFAVLHILAAVHYPLRPFLHRVRGPFFSLHLISLTFVCLLPVGILFFAWFSLFLSVPEGTLMEDIKLTQGQQIFFVISNALMSFLAATLLNASAAYALKQILEAPQKEAPR